MAVGILFAAEAANSARHFDSLRGERLLPPVFIVKEKKDNGLTFLPLGSIVRLKGGKVSLMVVGFAPLEPGTDDVFDYLGVKYLLFRNYF